MTGAQPGLLHAARQLAAVLAQENAALAARDHAAAGQLVDRKQEAVDGFTAAQAGAPALTPGERATMRPLAAQLRTLGEENRALLERAILVQQRVLGVVAGAARRTTPATGYGARGQLTGRTGAALLLRQA